MNAAMPPAAWALATACSATAVLPRTPAVDFDNPAARSLADAERHIQGDRAGGDDRDRLAHLVAEPHHRAFAVVLLNLRERQLEGFLAVR
jgi:hypothetical protein